MTADRRRAPAPAARDGGYALVMTALVLVPLMVFAAFSLDVGAWYARASAMQRAADAAALAGAVWMPDLGRATDAALATAARNGFVSGGDVTVTVARVPDRPQAVQVSIEDGRAPQFFSQLVMSRQGLHRVAEAEYVPPVPLGSPNNYLGTGSLFSGSPPRENVWLAVNGWCAARESGDPALAGFDGTWTGSTHACSVSEASENPDADPTGYLFGIAVPASPPAVLQVQVYDGAYQAGSTPNPDLGIFPNQTITTRFNLLGANSPYAPLTNPILESHTAASGDASWRGWRTVGTIVDPCARCTYFLQVYTDREPNSAGSNGFALRTLADGAFTACSTDPTSTNPPYQAGCTQLYAVERYSVFANISGATAEFALASIGSAHAGKVLEIQLFDLGEGSARVEILDPNGVIAPFDWTTECVRRVPATGGCSGSGVTFLNPNVAPAAQPRSRMSSTFVYNNRTLTLRVPLPTNYSALYGSRTWWKVRYTAGGAPTDRTTWQARVLGSPVRLR